MRSIGLVLLGLFVLVSAGCYHATIETGLPPSSEVIVKPFASSWIYGLVPPKTVETMAQCPRGVARVETRISFLNGLVGALTFSIYTPMEIKVTCAEKSSVSQRVEGAEIILPAGASREEIHDALARAARESMISHKAAFVRFEDQTD